MSTVKIRAGSLFRNLAARICPAGAAFRHCQSGFPPCSTGASFPSQDVHRQSNIPACAKAAGGCKVERDDKAAARNHPPV